jgi:uncharacterized protein (DUF1501 family)
MKRSTLSDCVVPRRAVVRALGLSALASVLRAGGVSFAQGSPAALATGKGGRRKVLVVVFQRGAVDGLSMVPPVADRSYYALRPSIAIPAPGAAGGAIKLDATFGLHPALGALSTHWDAGALALVHAVGSPDGTRSHFDAQDYVETGTPGLKHTEDGFLNRLLLRAPEKDQSSLRALAFSPGLPRLLAGKAPAVAISSLDQFKVQAPGAPGAATDFEQMYAAAVDKALRGTAGEAFDASRALREIKKDSYPIKGGAAYPASPLGKRMREISQVIQADLGVELVVTDCGGWDTHVAQGAATGQLAKRLEDLGGSLAAFATDLADRLAEVCVVTVTEFGRTARENGTGGTDHGHGSVMMVLGGKVRGKKVYGKWKGLAPEALYEGRDVPVTTDHRDVFGEVLRAHLGVKDLSAIFPAYMPPADARLGLFG